MRTFGSTFASGSFDFPVGSEAKRTSTPSSFSGSKGWIRMCPVGVPASAG